MEYKYSHQIDPLSYDNQGLCNGIPLRVSRFSDIDEAGTMRLRNDWREHVGPLPLASYGANMGPLYNFTSVAIPECRPERLEIVAYIMELGFLHDDLIDISKTSDAGTLNDQMLSNLNEGLREGKLRGSRAGEGRLVARLIDELAEIDLERSREVIKYWTSDLSTKRDRTQFKDFDDFLEYRIVDCGSLFLIALATFGMAITIPPHEKDLCIQLTRPVWAAAALTNDVQSWDKECRLVAMQDKIDMINGVWILMKQDSLSVEEAKDRVLQKAKDFAAEYVKTVEMIKSDETVSPESRWFIEAMQYMISGNLLWGTTTPRYHPGQTLNDMQIARLESSWQMRASSGCNGASHASCSANGANGVGNDAQSLFEIDLPALPQQVISAPSIYLNSLPSKNIRNTLIDSLNIWLDVADADIARIKRVINLLHNASLMLDDVQDRSDFRRGKPSAHCVFGPAQAINSANLDILEAMDEVLRMDDTHCVRVFSEELRSLYVGQGSDLFWTFNTVCPSSEQFLSMTDGKTGGLFRMMAGLMTARSRMETPPTLSCLMTLLGRYFQIRDDYMNISSEEYTEQKGFCEDLDEGKMSFPLIHALSQESESNSLLLHSLLSQRRTTGQLNRAQKQLILEQLRRMGSMDHTLEALKGLHAELEAKVGLIDEHCRVTNNTIRSLLATLDMTPGRH